jgi:UDP-galactopyranose mutase
MFNYIIVGSGFAGAVLAERIANVLDKKVLIIEKRNHIGGNCYDYKNIDNIIVQKYGPHIFHTDYKSIFDYISNFTDWHFYLHKVLAFIDGKKVPLPFNLNTIYDLFPKTLAELFENKLLMKYGYDSQINIIELLKEKDQDIQLLSNYIYNKIYKNYTAKQWGLNPEDIDPKVIARVPIYISKDNRYFLDKYQGVPKEGFSKIFERMLNHKNIKILLNTDYKEILKIDFENKKIYMLGQEFKGKLIYTGMLDDIFDSKFGKLPYRSANLIFETIDEEYYQEVSVVNYPNDFDFTRITEFKHIYPTISNRTTILKEYPTSYQANKNTPFYPILTEENKSIYERYKEEAEKIENLVLVGRLAEYRYYDIDDIVKRALEIFEDKIK